jgi:hypothetical protein
MTEPAYDNTIYIVTKQDVIDDWLSGKSNPNDVILDALALLDIMNDHDPWFLAQGVPNDVY